MERSQSRRERGFLDKALTNSFDFSAIYLGLNLHFSDYAFEDVLEGRGEKIRTYREKEEVQVVTNFRGVTKLEPPLN
jgi:hypothetical protein